MLVLQLLVLRWLSVVCRYRVFSQEYRTRVLVLEVSRAEELAERRRAKSFDRAGLEVEEKFAGHVLAARDFVLKN
jgi:hypothetical protein